VATLHVRNVPEELYEALRANAAVEGRSIGAQTVSLLQRALEDRSTIRERLRSQITTSFGRVRFLKQARAAVGAAPEEARALGHGEVGTEHLLLGLLRCDEVADALTKFGITYDEVRRRAAQLRPPGEPATRLAFSAEAKQALEGALRESLAMRHRHIGVEHVLLGIRAVGGSAGAEILRDAGADRDTLLPALLELVPIGTSDPRGPTEAEWEYEAVALTGSAENWAASLNRLAGEGWELVSIVGEAGEPRAVFRRPASEVD
jgi:ATP-dependent Clp protease ATP-binding subunit ClpC